MVRGRPTCSQVRIYWMTWAPSRRLREASRLGGESYELHVGDGVSAIPVVLPRPLVNVGSCGKKGSNKEPESFTRLSWLVGRRGGCEWDERGASLILALISLVVVSLIVLSMATWTSTGLNASVRFTAAQSIVSTANSATEVAAQSARYDFQSSTLDASPPVACLPAGFNTPSVPNGQSVITYCSTRWNPLSSSTRKVAFYTCLSTVSAASCALRPLLLAIVTYDDFPISGNYQSCSPTTSPTPPAGVSSCGTGMVVDTWVFGAVPPQVTGVQVQAIPPTCTTPQVVIDGTGFTSPPAVNFIATVTSSSGTSYVSYAAPKGSVVFVNQSEILACEPTSGSGTVDVVVSTPTGVSQMTSADQVTY